MLILKHLHLLHFFIFLYFDNTNNNKKCIKIELAGWLIFGQLQIIQKIQNDFKIFGGCWFFVLLVTI